MSVIGTAKKFAFLGSAFFCKYFFFSSSRVLLANISFTSVSLLINAGIQTQLISRRVGHSSVSTTSNIYSHIFNSTECEATEKLNEILKAN